MARPRSGLLLLACALLGSCALPTEGERVEGTPVPEAVVEAPAAPVTAPEAAEAAEPSANAATTPTAIEATAIDADEAPRVVPTGTFATIDALCREQMKLALPHIRAAEAAEKEWTERGETTKIAPRCEVSAAALAKVPVHLGGPFLEVKAILIETGTAFQTHLVTRTAAGWSAVEAASVDDYHNDPGCFSIERDSGIVSVRVEGTGVPALVVVEGSSRGAEMEDMEPDEAGNVHPIFWDDVNQRARGCRIAASGRIECDAPVVIRTERVPSTTDGGRQARLRFSTDAKVGATGHLQAASLPPQAD